DYYCIIWHSNAWVF
nr:immunoglobulin light chain junction region [Macaca mulatta]MOV96710.1 immunoglobulin light chain junction region [Macaca mulatta]